MVEPAREPTSPNPDLGRGIPSDQRPQRVHPDTYVDEINLANTPFGKFRPPNAPEVLPDTHQGAGAQVVAVPTAAIGAVAPLIEQLMVQLQGAALSPPAQQLMPTVIPPAGVPPATPQPAGAAAEIPNASPDAVFQTNALINWLETRALPSVLNHMTALMSAQRELARREQTWDYKLEQARRNMPPPPDVSAKIGDLITKLRMPLNSNITLEQITADREATEAVTLMNEGPLLEIDPLPPLVVENRTVSGWFDLYCSEIIQYGLTEPVEGVAPTDVLRALALALDAFDDRREQAGPFGRLKKTMLRRDDNGILLNDIIDEMKLIGTEMSVGALTSHLMLFSRYGLVHLRYSVDRKKDEFKPTGPVYISDVGEYVLFKLGRFQGEDRFDIPYWERIREQFHSELSYYMSGLDSLVQRYMPESRYPEQADPGQGDSVQPQNH